MKVFISWSGEKSRQTAAFLSDWIKCVLQFTHPWMSQKHIDRGALWFTEINLQLQDTTVGIICLTKENQRRPWILFESGALAKGLSTSRVCTFLIDLKPSDLEDPLAQFNHTLPQKDSVRSLVGTLNACLGVNALPSATLDMVFDTYWPQFESKFQPISEIPAIVAAGTEKTEVDYLAEILDTTRGLGARLSRLERDRIQIPSDDWNMRLTMDPTASEQVERIRLLLAKRAPRDFIRHKCVEYGIPNSVLEQLIQSHDELRKKKLTSDNE